MRTWLHWAKAIGAAVAAAGAVGIAVATLTGHPGAALDWYWRVWLPGAAVWLIGELVVPSPGYRWVARPPFLQRRAEVADLGHQQQAAPAARWVVRAAFVVHTAALAVYVIDRLVERLAPLP